jgi:hypothetical protein
VCNVEFILFGRRIVENETTFMKLLQVEFGEVAIGDKGGMLKWC